MKKRPSSEDVALRAGVSRATVSAYLNRSRYVSPELQRRIEQAIKELNYIPDPLARALKMNDAKTIGLIIPIVSNFYNPMIRAVNECAQQKSFSFLLASSEEDSNREKEILRIFLAKRISGILVVPCSYQNRSFLQQIYQNGIPIVQVNRKIDDLDIDSVVSNNLKAAYNATRHLIDRGRKRIVLFGYDPTSLANYEKKTGYDTAIKECKLPNLTIQIQEHNVQNFRENFNSFININNFDGLICTTQTKTIVALSILNEKKIRIPEEVAVVGFDDTPWSSLLQTPLTVISENTHQMGIIAAQMLLDRIEAKGKKLPEHIVLEDELVMRDSS